MVDPGNDAAAASLISPPLASPSSSAARKCRPPFSARPVRASCISFAAASGRETGFELPSHARPHPSARPTTAGRPGSSYRRLTTGTTTQWQFLTKTRAEATPPPGNLTPRSVSRPQTASPGPSQPSRQRPATARVFRVSASASSSSSSATTANSGPSHTPRRPATCRGPRTNTESARSKAKSMVLVDPRVLQEAVRHETEQEVYAGPLIGRSVDVQPLLDHLVHSNRDSRVVNAVSLAEFHRVKAFQARTKGDQMRAISHFEKLLEMAPDDLVALFQLAVAYEKTGQLQSAKAAYTRVLERDASNPFLHYNLGNLFMKLDLVDDAIVAYTAAIQRGGSGKCQQLAFYRQRGAAYRKKGDFEKAAQDYARVHVVRRRRSSLTTPSTATPVTGPEIVEVVPVQPEDVADASKTYSAEPMYNASHFTSQCISSTENSATLPVLDEMMHRKATEIAARPRRERSDDDLWLLSDVLQRRFAECAALDPIACKELSARIVAGTRLASGSVLIQEGTRGGAQIFFIARGRVDVYKKFAPRVRTSENQQPTESCQSIVSWEILRATMLEDNASQDDAAKEEAFQSVTRSKSFAAVDIPVWSREQQVLLTQLTAGDVCGRQGRFLRLDRSFSAVVSETCDFFAVSWADYLEVERIHREAVSEQVARFLTTVPLFHGISPNELARVSKRARNWKVVGERVVCCEGQHVNGILIVREGHLCQLYPSELARPPNLSVTFSLSGDVSVTGQEHDASERGLHFYTQLEFCDDPLLFVHDSALTHGFLPHDYLPRMLARLSSKETGHPQANDDTNQREEDEEEIHDEPAGLTVAPQTRGATSLARGAFFSASSSWIPPRKSRRDDLASLSSNGVACAKTGLVSTESSDLLFFTASDLTHGLSLASRTLLQKNMQQVLTTRRLQSAAAAASASKPPTLSKLSRLVFLKQPSGDDLVQKFVHDSDWKHYKQALVKSIVDNPEAKPLSLRPSAPRNKATWRR